MLALARSPRWPKRFTNMKILKGDNVTVLIGKDKGRRGEVVRALPKTQRVLVQGLNVFKKHQKGQKGQPGGIIEIEKPLYVSKVALICPNCQKPTRVGYQIDKSGEKYRFCKKCKNIIETKTNKK
jgi:large subunit ribosomal protein L24